MDKYELILLIKDYCNDNYKETCEIVKDLISQAESSKLSKDLEIVLDEFIDCNCLCPICFSPMESKGFHMELRGDYMGTESYEEITKWGCSECDYIIQ